MSDGGSEFKQAGQLFS